jgi:PAS domain S-box-containing protein
VKDKIKIVILEDDLIIANSMKENLELHGHRVLSSYSTGEEFLQNIDKLNPDIILIDIMLKGRLNGLEIAERIYPSTKTPIIFMSAHMDKSIIHGTIFQKDTPFLAKPIGNRELLTTVERVYNHAKSSRVRINEFDSNRRVDNRYLEDREIFSEQPEQTKEEILTNLKNEIIFQLKVLESSFNEIFKENETLLFIIDKAGILNYVNESMLDRMGIDVRKIFQKNIIDFIHPFDVEKFKFAIKSNLGNVETNITIDFRIQSQSTDWINLKGIFGILSDGNDENYISISAINSTRIKETDEILKNLLQKISILSEDKETTGLKRLLPSLNLIEEIIAEIKEKRVRNLNEVSQLVKNSFYSVIGFSDLLSKRSREFRSGEESEFKDRLSNQFEILAGLIKLIEKQDSTNN